MLLLLQLLALDADARRVVLQRASERMGGKSELGRALGYRDGAFVGQMIRGDRQITEKTLRALAELRSMHNLLDDSTGSVRMAEPERGYVPRIGANDALPRFLDAITALPPARWASVRAQLDQLAAHPEQRPEIELELQQLLTPPDAASRKRTGTTG